MYSAFAIAAVALLSGGVESHASLQTATTASSVAKDAVTASAAKPQRYCVVQQAKTGSFLDRKVCLTRDEWIARGAKDPAAATDQAAAQ